MFRQAYAFYTTGWSKLAKVECQQFDFNSFPKHPVFLFYNRQNFRWIENFGLTLSNTAFGTRVPSGEKIWIKLISFLTH